MNVVAFIFARGGSKGLPDKNIRPLLGKPLIAWSIEQARAVKCVNRVIVSTDSDEIAAVARQFGAEVPFIRPAELASDDAPEWLAWRHALSFLQKNEGGLPDAMISIPATAPLRLPLDLKNCLNEFAKGDADVIITVSDAHRNPWFNMVKENSDGSVGLVIEPISKIMRRQDAPTVFDITTVAFVARPQFVMQQIGAFSGRVRAVKIPIERSIDIDTLFDFELAEFFLKRRANRT
jgi:CMP-N-acetylneuraminic acid synthetase